MEGLSEMLTPDYLYRFVTERVRTINTTAIGGNASLLELGTE
jgi:delta 1-pyrroline-5-carboxylate dehydrogenase